MKFRLTIFIFSVLYASFLHSQSGIHSSSANFGDPRIVFNNPAGLAQYEYALFVAGHQQFYTGISGDHFQNGAFGVLYPFEKKGVLSLTGQYFSATIQHISSFDLSYARSFFNQRLSAGLNIGFLGYSFNSDAFNLINENDPLLADKTSANNVNAGMGLLANPWDNLYLGLSLDHINRPDLSLEGGQNKIDIKSNVSVLYACRGLRPMVQYETEAGYHYFSFGSEAWFMNEAALVRAFYSPEQLTLGAGVCYENFRLDYFYELSQTGLKEVAGSFHQFVLSYSMRPARSDFVLNAVPVTPLKPVDEGIFPNQTATYRLTLTPVPDFDKEVTLSTGKVPEGLSVSLSTEKMTKTDEPEIEIHADLICASGLYTFVVKGRSGFKRRYAEVAINIKPLPLVKALAQSRLDSVVVKEIQEVVEENPIINYVFFDENNFELDSVRYEILNSDQNPQFDFVFFPENINQVSEQYRNTLNTVAKRLLANPKMKIDVIGCNSGWGSEKENLQLSRKRAESVRKYLVHYCGVSEEQIELKYQNLPRNASSSVDPLGRVENQRVEIVPHQQSEQVLDPVYTEQIQNVMSDSTCIFDLRETFAEVGARKWEFCIEDRPGNCIRTFEGEAVPDEIEWDWLDDDGHPISPNSRYYYKLVVEDNIGQVSESPRQAINVVYQTDKKARPTKKVEKTRLILFEYDQDQVLSNTDALQNSLQKIVDKIVGNPDAKVTIKGYTDIIGDVEYNQQLSERRAKSIYDKLCELGVSRSQMIYSGYGKKSPLMDNDLPEGRMMNRRVEVIVIAPVDI